VPEGSVGSSEERHSASADPSAATTDALRREIAHLSDRIDLKIEGVVAAFTARLDAIDRATSVFSENLVRVPTAVQQAIGAEHALTDERFGRVDQQLKGRSELQTEKFEGIQVQIRERDARVQEIKLDTKTAVDAALSAAEKATSKQAESFTEAADKQAAAFTKAIDQQAALYQTETRALRDISATLDRRLTVIEGQSSGQQGARNEGHMTNSFVIAVIVAVISFIGLVIAMAGRLTPH
jgi:hypothetical protein